MANITTNEIGVQARIAGAALVGHRPPEKDRADGSTAGPLVKNEKENKTQNDSHPHSKDNSTETIMIICGITLSSGELYLLGSASTLLMLVVGIYAKNSIERRQKASEEFRSAFAGVVLNLRENPDCPIAQFTYAFHNEHLAAIVKFRDAIPAWKFWKLRSFDRAAENYKETYKMAQDYGSVFAVALSESTEVAKEKRKIYSDAINKLLSHA